MYIYLFNYMPGNIYEHNVIAIKYTNTVYMFTHCYGNGKFAFVFIATLPDISFILHLFQSLDDIVNHIEALGFHVGNIFCTNENQVCCSEKPRQKTQ